MKYLAHVPVEQYGYIEVSADSVDEIRGEYDTVKQAFTSGNGIDTKTFNTLLDTYLTGGTVENGGDIWGEMSEAQQKVFQEIKKSRARTKDKQLAKEVEGELLQDKAN